MTTTRTNVSDFRPHRLSPERLEEVRDAIADVEVAYAVWHEYGAVDGVQNVIVKGRTACAR